MTSYNELKILREQEKQKKYADYLAGLRKELRIVENRLEENRQVALENCDQNCRACPVTVELKIEVGGRQELVFSQHRMVSCPKLIKTSALKQWRASGGGAGIIGYVVAQQMLVTDGNGEKIPTLVPPCRELIEAYKADLESGRYSPETGFAH